MSFVCHQLNLFFFFEIVPEVSIHNFRRDLLFLFPIAMRMIILTQFLLTYQLVFYLFRMYFVYLNTEILEKM